MMKKIKSFFNSRPLWRFYRVVGYGIISLVLTNLTTLFGQLDIDPSTRLLIVTILTGIVTSFDKFARDKFAK